MKKTYELFTGDELKIAEKIQQRRYQLLIHSCIYYHLNQNIVSDQEWDNWAIELKNLQQQYPEISKQVTLYEYFKDWDAYTGFHLPITLDWVVTKACNLLDRQNISYSSPINSEHVVIQKKSKKKKLF